MERFLGKTRVKVDLVRKLRRQVGNTWAHATQQEFTDDKKADVLSFATVFVKSGESISP